MFQTAKIFNFELDKSSQVAYQLEAALFSYNWTKFRI